ncbi:MAG: TatD family hydrolase, partial [Enterobacter sp.]|nr:TatD family hydrolase [Enterobacter sp.]
MMHRFVDTHCHFDFPPFTGDEEQSIAKAAEAGVQAIIVPSVEAAYFSRVLDLAAQHPALYAALGLHPIVIERHRDEDIERLDEIVQTAGDKLVAIGEIGLDLYRE